MYRFATFSLLLVVAFFIAKHNNNGKNPLFASEAEKGQSLEGNTNPVYEKEEAIPELEGGFFERLLSRIFINTLKTERGRLLIEKVFQPVNVPASDPDFSMKMNDRMYLDSQLQMKVVEQGSGGVRAICGHKVEIDYKIMNMNNMILESGVKKIILGSGQMIKSMENLIIGMQEGGIRKGVVPSILAYEAPDYKGKKPLNKTSSYKLSISLKKIDSDVYIEHNTKIFDNEIAFRLPMLCGDKLRTHAKIMKIDGKVMYDSRKLGNALGFRLGDQSYPIIFSHGLFNKQDSGTRTIIFKGKYLKSFDGANPMSNFDPKSFNPEEYYILEFLHSQIEK
jgi:hypothetical protein